MWVGISVLATDRHDFLCRLRKLKI